MYCNGRRCMNTPLASLHWPNGTSCLACVLDLLGVHPRGTGPGPGRQGSRVAAACGVRRVGTLPCLPRHALSLNRAPARYCSGEQVPGVAAWEAAQDWARELRVRRLPRPRGPSLPLVPCIASRRHTRTHTHAHTQSRQGETHRRDREHQSWEPRTHDLVPSGRGRFGASRRCMGASRLQCIFVPMSEGTLGPAKSPDEEPSRAATTTTMLKSSM